MSDTDWRTRLSTLGRLASGWLDGSGKPMLPGVLEHTERILKAMECLDIPMPAVFPRPDGRVQLEWRQNTDEVIIGAPNEPIEVWNGTTSTQVLLPWSAGEARAHQTLHCAIIGVPAA